MMIESSKDIYMHWMHKPVIGENTHRYVIRIDNSSSIEYNNSVQSQLVKYTYKLTNVSRDELLKNIDIFYSLLITGDIFDTYDVEFNKKSVVNMMDNVGSCVNLIRSNIENKGYYTYNNFINNLASYLEKHHKINIDPLDNSLYNKLKVFMSPTLRLETGPDGKLNECMNRIDLLSYKLNRVNRELMGMLCQVNHINNEKENIIKELAALKG